MIKKLLVLTCFISTLFAVNRADLNINNDTLEINGFMDVAEYASADVQVDGMYMGAGLIDPDDRTALYNVQLLLEKSLDGVDGMKAGLGLKLLYADKSKENFLALAPGGFVEKLIPVDTVVPMYAEGIFYFSPKTLSMRSAESYLEYRLQLNFEIMEEGKVYFGYRNMTVEWDSNIQEKDYSSTVYVGLQIGF